MPSEDAIETKLIQIVNPGDINFGPQSLFGKTHNVSMTMTSMVAVSVNNYTHDIISFIEIFNKFITFTINKTIVSSLQ